MSCHLEWENFDNLATFVFRRPFCQGTLSKFWQRNQYQWTSEGCPRWRHCTDVHISSLRGAADEALHITHQFLECQYVGCTRWSLYTRWVHSPAVGNQCPWTTPVQFLGCQPDRCTRWSLYTRPVHRANVWCLQMGHSCIRFSIAHHPSVLGVPIRWVFHDEAFTPDIKFTELLYGACKCSTQEKSAKMHITHQFLGCQPDGCTRWSLYTRWVHSAVVGCLQMGCQ